MTVRAEAHFDVTTKTVGGFRAFGLDASRFPKFVKIDKYGSFTVWFNANNVNNGKNETGIKRVRKFLEIVGSELDWNAPALNSYKTLADFVNAMEDAIAKK